MGHARGCCHGIYLSAFIITDAQKVAATIGNSEERSNATAAIALHLGAHGQVHYAREIAAEVPIEHWRNWIESRLDLLSETGTRVIPSGGKDSSTKSMHKAIEVSFDSIGQTAAELLKQGMNHSNLHSIVSAVKAEDIEETKKAVERFWMSEVSGGKTCFGKPFASNHGPYS